MICPPCRDAIHSTCANLLLDPDRVGVDPQNGLWCFCQHKERKEAT